MQYICDSRKNIYITRNYRHAMTHTITATNDIHIFVHRFDRAKKKNRNKIPKFQRPEEKVFSASKSAEKEYPSACISLNA